MRSLLLAVLLAFSVSVHADAMQDKRADMIQRLANMGVLHKIHAPGGRIRVVIGRVWYGLSFDDKQAFMGVVYAYYHTDQGVKTIWIDDLRTNKSIGWFNNQGLYLD